MTVSYPSPRRPGRMWAGSRGNLLALGFGCLAALGFLLVVDVLLGILDARRQHERVFVGGSRVPDAVLGERMLPNLEETASYAVDGTTLWTTTYRTNAHGWRIGYEPARPHPPGRFLLFFGCSYTFGHGVEDWETLPSQTAAWLPEYQVYNFGGIGYGPQQMLALLESGEIQNQIAQPGGKAVYLFIADHIARALGTMRTTVRWTSHFPCYTYEEPGVAVRHGNFDTARPGLLRFYRLLNLSGTVRYTKIDFPLTRTDEDYALVAAMMRQSKDWLAKHYQLERFLVVLYPTKPEERSVVEQFRRATVATGVEVLDYRNLFDPDDPRYRIDVNSDIHPTPRAYAELAANLARDLEHARNE